MKEKKETSAVSGLKMRQRRDNSTVSHAYFIFIFSMAYVMKHDYRLY